MHYLNWGVIFFFSTNEYSRAEKTVCLSCGTWEKNAPAERDMGWDRQVKAAQPT